MAELYQTCEKILETFAVLFKGLVQVTMAIKDLQILNMNGIAQ